MGRTWSGYKYDIPDQFQGRYERLRVHRRQTGPVLRAADRRAARSCLDRLRREVRCPHQGAARDPQPVRQHRHRGPPTQDVPHRGHRLVRADLPRGGSGPAAARPVRAARRALRDVRRRPRAGRWPSICRFVGVEPGPSYLEACAAIVWPSTNRTRDAVDWTAGRSGTAWNDSSRRSTCWVRTPSTGSRHRSTGGVGGSGAAERGCPVASARDARFLVGPAHLAAGALRRNSQR